MIRQPVATKVAEMLVKAFADEGVKLSHQKSLNLAAQVKGYKNWAHLNKDEQAQPACAPSGEATPPETNSKDCLDSLEWLTSRFKALLEGKPVRDADECLAHVEQLLKTKSEPQYWVLPEEVAQWPVAVFSEDPGVLDEDGCVQMQHIFGLDLDELVEYNGRWAPEVDLSASSDWPDSVTLTNAERAQFIVLEKVFSIVPRIDRYGLPMFANEREAGDWALNMGWRYVGSRHQPYVECEFHETGDDSAEKYFAQVRVHPELAKRLQAAGIKF